EVRIDFMEGIRQRRPLGKLYLQLVYNEIAQTIAELQEIDVELEKAGADFEEVAVDFEQIVLDFKILRDLESRRSTLVRYIINNLDEVAAETGEVSRRVFPSRAIIMNISPPSCDGTTERMNMEKFKVVSWRDCHGVETFFRVVDKHGNQHGIFPSEW